MLYRATPKKNHKGGAETLQHLAKNNDPENFLHLNQLFPFLLCPFCFFEIIHVGLEALIFLLASSFVLSTEFSQITLLFRKCVAMSPSKVSFPLPNVLAVQHLINYKCLSQLRQRKEKESINGLQVFLHPGSPVTLKNRQCKQFSNSRKPRLRYDSSDQCEIHKARIDYRHHYIKFTNKAC